MLVTSIHEPHLAAVRESDDSCLTAHAPDSYLSCRHRRSCEMRVRLLKILLAVVAALPAMILLAGCASREETVPPQMGLVLLCAGGGIASSADGGVLWSEIDQPAGQIALEAMASDGLGNVWVVGDEVVAHTSDSGHTWWDTSIAAHLIAVAIRPESNVIWAAGASRDCPAILRSRDNGRSWKRSRLPSLSSPWVNGIAMANALNGWAVADSIVLQTTDGGATWRKELDVGEGQLTDVACADVRSACVVGESGDGRPLIASTTDGGQHWQVQRLRTKERSGLNAVEFVDGLRGWAVGDYGLITATRDGGSSWVVQNASRGANTVMLSVEFADRRRGWVSCGVNRLFWTADGGAHWHSLAVPGMGMHRVAIAWARNAQHEQ